MSQPLHIRIREAKTVPDALLMLASAIDDIYERLEARPAGESLDWGGGLDWPARAVDATKFPGAPSQVEANDATAQQRKVEKLREKIAESVDPDETRALEATLRLALEEHIHLGSAAVAPSVGDEVLGEGWASLAKEATPEQVKARKLWAKEVGLEQYMRTAEALKMAAEHGGNDVEELYSWFGHVGPRGLFTADHTACMQLPYEARLWLVERMNEEDEVLGRDMGADLLKSTDSMDRETAKEMYEPTWKS